MKDDIEAARQKQQQLPHKNQKQQRNKQMTQSGDQQLVRNNSDSKTMLAQQGTPDKEKQKASCSTSKCIFVFLMTILSITIAAIIVAILKIKVLDNEHQCLSEYSFQQPSYKFFATKTTYRAAHERLFSSGRNELPPIFSGESLWALNQKLLQDNCVAKQFHYYGRHAARFPSKDKITEINEVITSIQKRIDLSKFSQSPSNSDSINDTPDTTGNTTNVCINPMQPFMTWTSPMIAAQDDLVLNSGASETSEIVRRLSSIYPDLFNSNLTNLQFHSTNKLRTAQTALIFMKYLNFKPPGECTLDQFQSGNLSDPSMVGAIRKDPCLGDLVKNIEMKALSFHKQCADIAEKSNIVVEVGRLNYTTGRYTIPLAMSLSQKLKLFGKDQLTEKELGSIYDACRFETAILGSSIWCSLFTTEELRFLEYINDIEDFFLQAYGHESQYKSACPVSGSLATHLRQLQTNIGSPIKQEARFHFTHSEAIQRLIAASVDLSNDPHYTSSSAVVKNLQNGISPEAREWKTSLFTPFSANLAFTLYECSNQPSSTSQVMNVAQNRLKIVASLNEKPILLKGCTSYECLLDSFVWETKFSSTRGNNCDLENICNRKIELA